MLKQKLKINKILSSRAGIVTLALLLVTSVTGGLVAHADQFDRQIQALQDRNAANQASLDNLAAQASNYQDAINKLQEQINQGEAQITKTESKQTVVRGQIADAQKQLNHQKEVLGSAIKAMYIEGQTSTLEVLLSSDNLSDFVNQEQYHLTVENNIKTLVDKITALRATLKAQNDKLTVLLNQQKAQQATLASAQHQKNKLLSYNQAQQSHFNNLVATNNALIRKLAAEKQAAYAAATGGGSRSFGTLGDLQFRSLSAQQYCGGGYDYCGALFDAGVFDTWGLGLARECVHYAADRAAQGWNLAPYLAGYPRGNASNWPTNLSGVPGITVDRSPSTGAVAISVAANHAMYVEYNAGGGWWGVSQMNFDGRGSYSTMEVNQSSLWFVHFN